MWLATDFAKLLILSDGPDEETSAVSSTVPLALVHAKCCHRLEEHQSAEGAHHSAQAGPLGHKVDEGGEIWIQGPFAAAVWHWHPGVSCVIM